LDNFFYAYVYAATSCVDIPLCLIFVNFYHTIYFDIETERQASAWKSTFKIRGRIQTVKTSIKKSVFYYCTLNRGNKSGVSWSIFIVYRVSRNQSIISKTRYHNSGSFLIGYTIKHLTGFSLSWSETNVYLFYSTYCTVCTTVSRKCNNKKTDLWIDIYSPFLISKGLFVSFAPTCSICSNVLLL